MISQVREKYNKFTFVNVCFQHEHNADSGHYGQTQNSLAIFDKYCQDFRNDKLILKTIVYRKEQIKQQKTLSAKS